MTYKDKRTIGDCTLYLGDALHVLPTLESVDAVVTDPPYGIAVKWQGGSRHGWQSDKAQRTHRNSWDERPLTADEVQVLLSVWRSTPVILRLQCVGSKRRTGRGTCLSNNLLLNRSRRGCSMVSEKLCRRCSQTKAASEFRADSRYKDGLGSWCKACHKDRNSSWAKENRERLTKKAAKWRAENEAAWRQAYRSFHARNKEERATQHAAWAKANSDKRRASDARHKAAKLRATPVWANQKKINELYRRAVHIQAATGIRMHVDHIVPLQHEVVCGLHCEANLQVLPGALNEAKKNYWWPDGPFEDAYKQPDFFTERPAPAEQLTIDGMGDR